MWRKLILLRETVYPVLLVVSKRKRKFHNLTMSSSSKTAYKTWEMSNNVQSVATIDDIFRYDAKQHQDILMTKPWDKE